MRKRFVMNVAITATAMSMLFSNLVFAAYPKGKITWNPENSEYGYMGAYNNIGYGGVNGWRWLYIPSDNGEKLCCYYFHEGSVIRGDSIPDGYQVDDKGRWVVDGVVQTKPLTVDKYTKPSLDPNIYAESGLSYKALDIMTMRPDDSIAKYGAISQERSTLNDGKTKEAMSVEYTGNIKASIYTNMDGSMGQCRITASKSARDCFGYAPAFESPANLDIDEAIKYYTAVGFKKVDISENVNDGEFYVLDMDNEGNHKELVIITGGYGIKSRYDKRPGSDPLIYGKTINIRPKDMEIRFDLEDMAIRSRNN